MTSAYCTRFLRALIDAERPVKFYFVAFVSFIQF